MNVKTVLWQRVMIHTAGCRVMPWHMMVHTQALKLQTRYKVGSKTLQYGLPVRLGPTLLSRLKAEAKDCCT